MSGHSKWSNIKRQKQLTDAIRGQIFTKLANVITVVVRESGGNSDPESNFKLRLVIEKAKRANMPKVNIERAINRGLGKSGSGDMLAEVVYEGFASGGVAVLAEGVTDNKQRTTALIKNIFINHGGHLAGVGSVDYLFKKIGEIHLSKNSYTYDQMMELAIESGADDIEEDPDRFIILCPPQTLHHLKVFFESKKIPVLESELTFKPITHVEITEQSSITKIINLLTALENLDEIHKVHANFITRIYKP